VGHYIAIVKYDDRYLKFNDASCEEIDRRTFLTLSEGGNEDSFSAYILVYVDKAAKVDGFGILEEIPPATLGVGGGGGDALKRALFLEPAFCALVTENAPFEVRKHYYFDVFCHTSLLQESEALDRTMARRRPDQRVDPGSHFVITLVDLPDTESAALARWMCDNFVEKVRPVLINARERSVWQSLLTIIANLPSDADVLSLLPRLIDVSGYVATAGVVAGIADAACKILSNFWPIDRGWVPRLVGLLQLLADERHHGEGREAKELYALIDSIEEPEVDLNWMEATLTLTTHGVRREAPEESILRTIRQTPMCMELADLEAANEANFQSCLYTAIQRLRPIEVLASLNRRFRADLLSNSAFLVLPWFVHEDRSVREATERLVYSLCEKEAPKMWVEMQHHIRFYAGLSPAFFTCLYAAAIHVTPSLAGQGCPAGLDRQTDCPEWRQVRDFLRPRGYNSVI
jgi:hypothetical protein